MEIVPSSPRTPVPASSSPAHSPAKVRSAPTSPYALSLGSPYLVAARRIDNDAPLDKDPEPSPILPAPHSAQALRAFLMTCVAWSATVTTCLGPFFPLYMKEKFNASTTLIGLCFSVLALAQFVTCPVVMPTSRRITRLNSLRGGLVISIAGTLLFGLVDRIPGFIIGRIISGVGDAFIEVSSMSFLLQYSPNIRKDIGLLEGASSIGYLLGPLLGGFLFFELGFQAVFLVMAAPYLVLLFVLCFVPSLFPPPPSQQQQQQQDTQPSPPSAVNPTSSHTTPVDASSSTIASAASSSAAAAAHPTLSTRESLLRLGRALCSTPSIPLYVLVVMFVSGGMGWLDTSLAEHLVLSLGVTTEQAGLLFTVHTLTYLIFSFFAAEIAFRMGEWRAIVGGMVVWSGGLLFFGPAPVFHLFKGAAGGGEGGGAGGKVVGLMAGILAVLGVSETFVFLPFVPLVNSRFQDKLGWDKGEAEDVVSTLWATCWSAGQTLGPLVGGVLMDSLPKTREVGCVLGREEGREGAGEGEGGVDYDLVEMQCRSAFPWTSGVWGGVGLVLAFLLFMAMVRARMKKVWQECRKGRGGWEDGGAVMQEEAEGVGGEGGREGGKQEGGPPYTHLPVIIAPISSREAEGGELGEEEGVPSFPPSSLSPQRSSWNQAREAGREGREGGKEEEEVECLGTA